MASGTANVFDVAIDPAKYPQARRDDSVVDDFHGTKVPDPYRWLEDPDAEETKTFVQKLNEISEPFLKASDVREKMRERLTKLWDYEKYGCTARHGDFYYYYYNSGLQNQSVLYQQKSLDEKGTVFMDPNKLSDDGTTFIRQSSWTDDGTLLAYGVSEKGSDWVTIKFKRNTGEDLADEIKGVKFSGIDWLHNNEGVFYSKYPEHTGKAEGTEVKKHEFHSLFFHKLGTPYTDDVLVAEFRDNPSFMCSGGVTEDGRYLIVDVNKGCDPTNQLYYFDLQSVDHKVTGKLPLKPLFDKFDAKYDVVDNDGDSALVLTNHEAPMFKLVRVKMATANLGAAHWETVIAEDERRKLDWVAPIAGDKMVVAYVEDVKASLYVHDLRTGALLYPIPLPIGSISGFYGRKRRSEIFFAFESFLTPSLIYHVDFAKVAGAAFDAAKDVREIRRVRISGVDTDSMDVKQVFYASKDGTKVPMYILHKKDIALDGNNPTLLNGYGGFNIADMPYFSVSRLLFMQHLGGIVACANIRGGSEYGEKWHEAGMKERKQNVFDDFIAAAEYLVANKYTSPSRLGIQGGSNGGLLMAAVSQQRPDLFGAVLNRVGVMDMLRFHKFTIGAAWLPEYGNPDEAGDFPFIFKYSPLHNIRVTPGVQWPATMMMTADHDDRVVPSHTLKYVAQLYHTLATEARDTQRQPVIARIEVKAGHGAGKPTSKIIAELVDLYCFLQRVLRIEWRD